MTRVQTLNRLYGVSAAMILLPLLCTSREVYSSAKAKFYQMPDGLGTPSGACGYGEYGRSVYNGNVVAVSSRSLYGGGAGCGACYQIKCKAPECSNDGVNLVLTDDATADEAEFILSLHAFTAMANPGEEKELKDYGVVDVYYTRVSCEYAGGENLRVKVLEQSNYPYYLAFVFLYQGGISSITAVEIFEEEKIEWKACRRSYGAVWEITNPPNTSEALTLRLFLPGGGGGGGSDGGGDGAASSTTRTTAKWVILPKAIPSSWKPGASYNTSTQIS